MLVSSDYIWCCQRGFDRIKLYRLTMALTMASDSLLCCCSAPRVQGPAARPLSLSDKNAMKGGIGGGGSGEWRGGGGGGGGEARKVGGGSGKRKGEMLSMTDPPLPLHLSDATCTKLLRELVNGKGARMWRVQPSKL